MAGQRFDEVVDVSSWTERFVVHKDDVARKIGSAIKSASDVLLASDPDREGEAIAWHVAHEFGALSRGLLKFEAAADWSITQLLLLGQAALLMVVVRPGALAYRRIL